MVNEIRETFFEAVLQQIVLVVMGNKNSFELSK